MTPFWPSESASTRQVGSARRPDLVQDLPLQRPGEVVALFPVRAEVGQSWRATRPGRHEELPGVATAQTCCVCFLVSLVSSSLPRVYYLCSAQ